MAVQDSLHLFPLIVILSFLLAGASVTEATSECLGLPYESKQFVECKLKIEDAENADCTLKYPLGTVIHFRCKGNYIPTGATLDELGDAWEEATCSKNSLWEGLHDFETFTCVIDYGKFYIGDQSTPLILGERVNPYDFPWHAALFQKESDDSFGYICGGTLIDANFVLTAAHCTFRLPDDAEEPISAYELRVLLAPYSGNYEDNNGHSAVQRLQVSEIVKYTQQYRGKANNFRHDLVLLRLSTYAELNKFVQPVRLPLEYERSMNTMIMQVNGYGTNGETDRNGNLLPSKTFYGTNVTMYPSVCMDDPRVKNSFSKNIQFCTTPTNPDDGICSGDSGGGSFRWEGSDYWSIQGIVSRGIPDLNPTSTKDRGCFYIVILTKLNYYLKWIKQQIQGPPYSATPGAAKATPTTTTPAPPPDRSNRRPILPYYAELGLTLQNEHRAFHKAPPLRLDNTLQKEAEEFAIYLARSNSYLIQKKGVPYGQNLFEYRGQQKTPEELVKQAVEFWYSGAGEYDWANPSLTTTQSSAFSQMVWVSSLYLGLGLVAQGERIVIVAFYTPRGNVQGQFKQNVLPGLTSPQSLAPVQGINEVALQLHNEFRRRHGVPPLQSDYELSREAQNYANNIAYGNWGLQPKAGLPYGQNVYEDEGVALSPVESVRKACNYWYNGISEYFWNSPLGSTYKGLTFSQVVWKSTARLGIGVATKGTRNVVIAYYAPPGNVFKDQSYRENVLPPLG